MRHDRQRGIVFSALLHLFWLLFAIFGLPSLLNARPPEEPAAITVEILPITGETNVKPAEQTPAPEEKPPEEKPEEKPPEPPKPEEKPDAKPTPPVKTEEETKPPPPPEPKPDQKKEKEKEKDKEKDKKKDKKKPKEEDLMAVLKAVKDQAAKESKKDTKDEKNKDSGSKSKSISNSWDPTKQMSMSEKDAIMSQIAKCWNVPAGAKDAQNLSILLLAKYNKDGSLVSVVPSDEAKQKARDPFFRSAMESALRAVRMCNPLVGLPPEKYDAWGELELNFDPRYMLQ